MDSGYILADMLEIEHDFTADKTPILRDPVYLSPEEEALYVRNDLAYSGIDFTDPNGEDSWKDKIVVNEGWKWYADNVDNDKFGFIADKVSGGQHIAISLEGAKHGTVEISYTVSYENFGIALAWLGDRNEDKVEQWCSTELKSFQPEKKKNQPHRLFAIWEEKASVPKVDLLPVKLDEGETQTLHICLTPKSKDKKVAKGDGNKFKLLEVRVY